MAGKVVFEGVPGCVTIGVEEGLGVRVGSKMYIDCVPVF